MNPKKLKNLAKRLEVASLWVLSHLKPLALFNLLVRRDGYRSALAIPYGSLDRQLLDVYSPPGEISAAPVVLFFYGGSWQSGRRQDYRFVAQALTSRGCVAVIPDYRLYPVARFPDFIDDGAAALAWVRDHIQRFGGHPQDLFVMGHSAGAYIAAMLAVDQRYLHRVGRTPQDIRGFIGLAGPYDFLPLKSLRLVEIFGAPDGIPETQPVNLVTTAVPPALLLHGATDRIVQADNSRSLARRWQEAGRPVVEIIYPHYKHLTILLYLASFLQEGEPVLDDIMGFIRTHRARAD